MKHKLYCNLNRPAPATSGRAWSLLPAMLLCVLGWAPSAAASGDAPQWMHALVDAPVPAHDEKTDAVLVYSETITNVQSVEKIKTTVRAAYKILRPAGRDYGHVAVYFDSNKKIRSLHGWCIPAPGKDYEVKDKDGIEAAPPSEGGELIDDVKVKIIKIPASDPGNIVGYEYETEEHPLVLQKTWHFQHAVPVREGRYTLQLPAGWGYKASSLNYPEIKPTPVGSSQCEGVGNDLKAAR